MWLSLVIFIAQADPASEPATAPSSEPTQTATPIKAVSVSVNPDQAQLTGAIKKPWSIIAGTTLSIGTGSFVSGSRDPFVGQSLGVSPSWVFALPGELRIRASASQSFSWEYTLPDNGNGRRYNWSDTTLGGSARIYQIPVADIDLWGGLRFVLPISLTSQRATLITALIPGLGASRSFEWTTLGRHMTLNLRYDFVYRKNFHRLTNASIIPEENNNIAYGITRASDTLLGGGLARGFASTDMTFTNALSITYGPADWVSLTLFAGITNVLSYPLVTTRDELTSPYASVGAGRQDSVQTNLDCTFTVIPQFMVSLGIFTAQPPFAPNNRTLNNPFFATSNAALNYTTLYLSLTGML